MTTTQNFRPRRWSKDDPQGVMQIDDCFTAHKIRLNGKPTMNETVLRLAHAEYKHQHGSQQDYERMQERGGLSILEVILLLADYVERLGGKPTKPRKEPKP